MCRRWVYAFVVWSLCLGVARGNLTMAPLSSWSITGDQERLRVNPRETGTVRLPSLPLELSRNR